MGGGGLAEMSGGSVTPPLLGGDAEAARLDDLAGKPVSGASTSLGKICQHQHVVTRVQQPTRVSGM